MKLKTLVTTLIVSASLASADNKSVGDAVVALVGFNGTGEGFVSLTNSTGGTLPNWDPAPSTRVESMCRIPR